MRGAYIQFMKEKGCACSRKSSTVEQAVALRKEAAELRLARIQNGKDPLYKNGKTLVGCSENSSGQLKREIRTN